jgi:poly(beta-D-mannuronate) lyase
VVTAQIHDAESDVMEVAARGQAADRPVRDGAERSFVVDPTTPSARPYDLRLVATDGRIDVLYNGRPAGSIPQSGTGWYFKTGSYLQIQHREGRRGGCRR